MSSSICDVCRVGKLANLDTRGYESTLRVGGIHLLPPLPEAAGCGPPRQQRGKQPPHLLAAMEFLGRNNDAEETTSMGRAFAVLVTLRIVNSLLVRTYFDPDEYWQSLEIAYCMAFDNPQKCHK